MRRLVSYYWYSKKIRHNWHRALSEKSPRSLAHWLDLCLPNQSIHFSSNGDTALQNLRCKAILMELLLYRSDLALLISTSRYYLLVFCCFRFANCLLLIIGVGLTLVHLPIQGCNGNHFNKKSLTFDVKFYNAAVRLISFNFDRHLEKFL